MLTASASPLNLRVPHIPFHTGPSDEQKKIDALFESTPNGEVFITFQPDPQLFLYTVFFSAVLPRSV